MDYLIAVQAPAFAVSPTTFATEGAFAEHLRELKRSLATRFDRLVLIAPSLTQAEYEAKRQHLGVVDLGRDGVLFVPAHHTDTSARRFWLALGPLWRRIRESVRSAGVVHSGMSDDLFRPLMALVNLAGWLQGRPVVFVVDIDFRQNAARSRQLGLWSRKSYLITRLVYDPLKWIQVWLAPRMFQLVLLKSASMVRDFGAGRPNVRNFYDTAHSSNDLLTPERTTARLAWLAEPQRPLQLVFFGRFVAYKGLDRAIEAVRLARETGEDVRLLLVGEGDCQQALESQVARGRLQDVVTFRAQVPYGPQLFDLLTTSHACIATPLLEDTPRAVFDAMARGLPIVAFDISYFRNLAQMSEAVALAAWPDSRALADRLVALSRKRDDLVRMAQRGLAFAADNTQAAWLERRSAWIEELARESASRAGRRG